MDLVLERADMLVFFYINGGRLRMRTEVEQTIGAVEPKAKEWRPPTLRRLPVVATSSATLHNEGLGQGKGNSGTEPS